MSTILELLRRFNRKEGFLLLAEALGSFRLSECFRSKLSHELDLVIPADAYVAMDYHYDWLYAAVHFNHSVGSVVFDNQARLISGNQRDMDLVIAFDQEEKTHVIAIEAKAFGAWGNDQMREKVDRLRAIFGDEQSLLQHVCPHLVLMSPNRPTRLDSKGWPAWLFRNDTIPWLPLELPKDSLMTIRCDARGIRTSLSDYWTIADGHTEKRWTGDDA
jgi:hypothetical protein